MSDRTRVKSDTKHSEIVMRALADTSGMSTPQKANYWLESLMKKHHRGPHDTWTAARDRAAKAAGIELTMAKRIWQRWQDMRDVGGETVIKLMTAYEALCQANDEAAERYKAERHELRKSPSNETSQEPHQSGHSIGAAHH